MLQRAQADKRRRDAEEGVSAELIAARVKIEVKDNHAGFKLQSVFSHSRGPDTADTTVHPPPPHSVSA